MKKNLFCMFLLLCAVSFFPSCSDDDTPPPMVGTEYDGVYKGTLDVVAPSLNIDVKEIPQKIYITKVGDNLFKLQLKNFAFQTFELGTIEVSDLKVVKSDEFCTFSGSDELVLTVGTCDVSVEGTISAGKTKIDIDVKVLDGLFKDLEVSVAFKGDKMAVDQSSEAQITSFVVNTDPATSATIDHKKKEITLTLADNLPSDTLTPTIATSTGAKVTPESGKEQAFNNLTPVKYTVVSEDGISKTEYTVKVIKKGYYDFEEWSTALNKKYSLPTGKFGSTNDGIQIINDIVSQIPGIMPSIPGDTSIYCVISTPNAKSGNKAVQIQTVTLQPQKQSIYDLAELLGNDGAFFKFIADAAPYNTAGSFFLGTFKTDMENTLRSTKFGIPYTAKPVSFSGWYKYTPGEFFRDKDNAVVEGKTDECALYAVLYEAKNEAGEEVTLTGEDVNKSPYVILRAELEDRTAKAEWTYFDLQFKKMNNKEYDYTKTYKLAFICTSSNEGDAFRGAPGSTMVVDSFEITSE